MSDAILHLMMMYKKTWWDMTLKERADALEQYIYGSISHSETHEKMRRETSDL